MLFLQCNKSHFTAIKMKGMYDLLMDETFHCKWHFTSSESQNKIYFLKNCSKSILYSQIFVSQWQAILDTVCIHLAQERYKRWPVLNMVKSSLILYIFCTTTVQLQYLIPTVAQCFFIPLTSFGLSFWPSLWGWLFCWCVQFIC
jgi:hypothetical protein